MASSRLRRLTVAVSLAALTTGGAWTLGAQSASAASTNRYVATNGSDTSNACTTAATPCKTIQYAVDQATSDNTIHIAEGTYPESVLVGQGDDAAANATFVGAGADKTKVTGYPAGSGTVGFGFDIENVPATLRDLAVTGVQAGSGENGAPGFGVEVEGGQATLTDVDVSGNADVGVFAEGSELTATGSHFDRNGTGALTGLPACGVFSLGGTASIDTSSASSNAVCGVFTVSDLSGDARTAAQAPVSGLQFTRSTAADNKGPGLIEEVDPAGQVSDSTIAGNTGYGIVTLGSNLNVTNSTITGTKKDSGFDGSDEGGIVAEDLPNDVQAGSPAKINAVLRKVSSHATGKARRLRSARVVAARAPASSALTVTGSIVADNSVPDCSQKVTDGGYNLSSDAKNSCDFSTAEHSLTKSNPKLGSLGLHGGLTQTQLPLKTSPAIDAIPAGSAGCAKGAFDQRGVARPQPTGGRCDIGSVELAGAKLAITTASLPNGTVGKDYSAAVHATGGQYPTYTWTLASGSVPGLSFSTGGVFTGKPTKAGTYTVTVSVNDPVTKTYTIVIDAPGAGTDGSGSKLADTGVPTMEITGAGLLLVFVGLLALYAAGMLDRPLGRHRRPAN